MFGDGHELSRCVQALSRLWMQKDWSSSGIVSHKQGNEVGQLLSLKTAFCVKRMLVKGKRKKKISIPPFLLCQIVWNGIRASGREMCWSSCIYWKLIKPREGKMDAFAYFPFKKCWVIILNFIKHSNQYLLE